jgi:uncharacterized protein
MNLDFFDWDQGNSEKVQKHGLKIRDIEQFLLSNPRAFIDVQHSKNEIRFIALDYYKEKLVFAVFVIREHHLVSRIRVISARYAKEKERIVYEKKIKSQKQ